MIMWAILLCIIRSELLCIIPQVMTILVLSDDHLGPWALNNIACYMSLRYSPVIVDFLLGQMAILSLSPHICPHRLWAI
jgi:hypothetical protein